MRSTPLPPAFARSSAPRLSPTARTVLAAVLLGAAATIGGALIFEHGLGLRPCKLCLQQRTPYYVAMAVALGALFLPPRWQRAALVVLALVFVVSAGMGVHHAGVEWGFWAGPSDCGGTPAPQAGSMGDFLNQLQTTRVVSCTEAAWRFLGLSLAGWNVVISLALAGLALLPVLRSRA
jgi:disulfide bond formation protein DsbB